MRRALLIAAFAAVFAAVPGVAAATPGMDQQCATGSLAAGDNDISAGAGQGVDIKLESYGPGFNVQIYSMLGPTAYHLRDVYVPPFGLGDPVLFYDGIWGTEPVPHRYRLVIPANVKITASWTIMSNMCA